MLKCLHTIFARLIFVLQTIAIKLLYNLHTTENEMKTYEKNTERKMFVMQIANMYEAQTMVYTAQDGLYDDDIIILQKLLAMAEREFDKDFQGSYKARANVFLMFTNANNLVIDLESTEDIDTVKELQDSITEIIDTLFEKLQSTLLSID